MVGGRGNCLEVGVLGERHRKAFELVLPHRKVRQSLRRRGGFRIQNTKSFHMQDTSFRIQDTKTLKSTSPPELHVATFG